MEQVEKEAQETMSPSSRKAGIEIARSWQQSPPGYVAFLTEGGD